MNDVRLNEGDKGALARRRGPSTNECGIEA